MAAAKCNLKVYDMDYSIDSVAQMRKCLTASQCKTIFFADKDDDLPKKPLKVLRKAIPELFDCTFS